MVPSRYFQRQLASHLRRQFNNVSRSHLPTIQPSKLKLRKDTGINVQTIFKSNFSSQTPPSAFESSPPSTLHLEMAEGVQKATLLYIRHGLGRRRLDDLATQAKQESDPSSTLVTRWQRMMEVFLGTQVHVLAGLGYPATEQGIAVYNQQLALLMQGSSPEVQENLRIQGRDLWREVLCLTFNLDMEADFKKDQEGSELSIVDARNIMHKVSQRMQEPDILEKVAKKAASEPSQESDSESITRKHTVVQEVLVHDVYLGKAEGQQNTLVEECGFGTGEKGYVKLQCLMAEHQTDPLVTQYMGGAMVKLMDAAGIDLAALQQKAQEKQK